MNNSNHDQQYEELFQKGLAALRKKNYDYAIQFFTDISNKSPENSQYLHYLWSSLREKQNSSTASVFKSAGLNIRAFLLDIQALYFKAAKQPETAAKLLKEIVLLNPNNISALFKLATVFTQTGKHHLAITALEEIILIKNNNVSALKLLSRFYFEAKEFKKAKSTASIVLRLSPHDLEAENILKNIAALNMIEEGFDNLKPAE